MCEAGVVRGNETGTYVDVTLPDGVKRTILFNADGSKAGGEFRLNTTTAGEQIYPAVTALADGGFVAVYRGYFMNGGSSYDVFFQRFGANGAALGAETRANPSLGETFSYQSQPALAVLESGSFVVVWTDGSLDGSGSGVFGQRFTLDKLFWEKQTAFRLIFALVRHDKNPPACRLG